MMKTLSWVQCSIALLLLPMLEAASTSRLQIQIPHELKKADGYDHREALFGIPPYGGSIQQLLYYTEQSLCDGTLDKTAGWPKRSDGKAVEPPFILMVERGGCTFVEKVRHAQRAGAAAVLIADNICQCADMIDDFGDNSTENSSDVEGCTHEDESVMCEMTEPVMADDGSGSDISIPSFLVFKQDADPIKKAIKENTKVRVEMKFSLPAPDSRVEYDFWTTPKDFVSRAIEGSFKSAALALGSDAFFTPHMYIYDGEVAGCRAMDGTNECFTLCTNSGRYCATDPDDDLERGVSGADVVTESLRRMCIWQKYGADGIGREWWDYVEEFMFRCDSEKNQFFTSETCIEDVMKRAGVDKAMIDNCMSDSGGVEGDKENVLLEKELQNREKSGVVLIPSLFVNNAPIRGEMAYVTAFRAICSGYAVGYEPEICLKCMHCPETKGCVERGHCHASNRTDEGVSGSTFAGSMLGLTLVFCIIGGIMHRRQQLQMRAEFRGIVAEYMPVGSDKNGGTSLALTLTESEGEFTLT